MMDDARDTLPPPLALHPLRIFGHGPGPWAVVLAAVVLAWTVPYFIGAMVAQSRALEFCGQGRAPYTDSDGLTRCAPSRVGGGQ